MRKLIFLDIDGVLNTNALLRQNIFLCSTRISLLSSFCEDNDIDIVISSSWREIYTLDELRNMLSKEGFVNTDRFIGVTGNIHNIINNADFISVERGYEIEDWLTKQAISYNYVILDDTSDFLDYQKSRVVLTDFNKGLDVEHLRKIKTILDSK